MLANRRVREKQAPLRHLLGACDLTILIGRIRRPPPLTVELVLSQPGRLGESEDLMSSQAGAFESRVGGFLEHRADEALHQSTNVLDWEAILLGHLPRPHECLQMSGAARSQGELLPSPPDFAFIDVDGTSAATHHARVVSGVLASADSSRHLHTNALCCAVDRGLADITQCLLRAGAEPMRRDETGRTALHYAARHSDAAILNGLLALEVNIDVKDLQGRTPLFSAVESGSIESARRLLQHGANVYVKDDSGVTVLCLAVKSGFMELVKVLLEFGADVNA
ncbi:ankyrin repeats (3 copies) domain-containing protein [Cordyceps javanica]|uniref:Ankyrin repeats (3 copies) domain-containing protein n=1 Tax=Cordyceps javanica TaxID=43265 RepID=A0A545UUZ4_9HYPO|nr:ankyrin repeats (3 copies) domain-containing protein [Cordyceps javanica]TQW05376.1 ankyrin repeats (3 copies) domain-containing protein [Cordyceps javanica]